MTDIKDYAWALHYNATEAIGPFYVVPMPYNAEGRGPEMDPAKVVGVKYEVWDSLIVYQRSFSVLEEAMAFAGFLNSENE